MICYGFTKAADLAIMRGFAQALSASGVTVNAVLPGPTHTEGVDAMFASMGKSANDPKAQRDFIDGGRPSSIIKRLAEPEENRHGCRVSLLARGKRHHRRAGACRRRRCHVHYVTADRHVRT